MCACDWARAMHGTMHASPKLVFIDCALIFLNFCLRRIEFTNAKKLMYQFFDYKGHVPWHTRYIDRRKIIIFRFGTIQVYFNVWGHSKNTWQYGERSRRCHQMTRGGERGSIETITWHFVFILKQNFASKSLKKECFLYDKNSSKLDNPIWDLKF